MRSRVWSLTDQVAASASNALVVLLMANTMQGSAFGAFAVTFSMISFLITLSRSAFAYPVSLASDSPKRLRLEYSHATSALLLGAPAIVAVMIGWALAARIELDLVALLVVASTPIVLVQDTLRYSAVAAKRPEVAALADGTWLVVVLIAITIAASGILSAAAAMALWLVGGFVSTAILALQLRPRLSLRSLPSWLTNSWQHRTAMSTGALVAGASIPVAGLAILRLAGPGVAGGLAGAGQLMAPTNVLVAYLSLTLLAEGEKRAAQEARRSSERVGIYAALATLAWGILLLLMPASVGALLLGEVWQEARAALPAIGIQYAIAVLAQTGTFELIRELQSRHVLTTSLAQAVSRLSLAVTVAAVTTSVALIAWGQAAAMAIWLSAVLIAQARSRR